MARAATASHVYDALRSSTSVSIETRMVPVTRLGVKDLRGLYITAKESVYHLAHQSQPHSDLLSVREVYPLGGIDEEKRDFYLQDQLDGCRADWPRRPKTLRRCGTQR